MGELIEGRELLLQPGVAVLQFFAQRGLLLQGGICLLYTSLDSGGLVRVGFAHYNTVEELARLFATLRDLGPA